MEYLLNKSVDWVDDAFPGNWILFLKIQTVSIYISCFFVDTFSQYIIPNISYN